MKEIIKLWLEGKRQEAWKIARLFSREDIVDYFHFDLGWTLFQAAVAMKDLKPEGIRGEIVYDNIIKEKIRYAS